MRVLAVCASALCVCSSVLGKAPSTAGIEGLIKRRLPEHVGAFEFAVESAPGSAISGNETYTVSSTKDGKIRVEGSSTSATLSGLHRYLADVAHVDIWWYIGSKLSDAPSTLPKLSEPLEGSSTVPYRYHFNTVTTSYTSAFWSWEDWELELDWMALRGINLPLAWIGIEKIFIEVFQEIGLSDEEIASFLSGPAFLAWNHFGNIQGSWGGSLPYEWADDQFEMQLKIVERMIELGMTPVLPAFPGFVPRAITRIWPNATIAKSPDWSGFSSEYTEDTYLDPFDPHFASLQKTFIKKQQEAYGNVTSFWTLDQFNENKPASGDLDYLRNVSHNTWAALKEADPSAIWVMQGWLFSSDSSFWSDERVEAFLGGVPEDSDMLILDLFAESMPQWQRTKSFYGKPWIWCQLHDYGGNMGLYGQLDNVTINAVDALRESSSLVGYGLSPEGQEGNEIIYDILLDQAWSAEPIDTKKYFDSWVASRYGGAKKAAMKQLSAAWDAVRTTVYNNTNLTVNAVPKSILELAPSTTGMLDRTGHHATIKTYKAEDLVQAWKLMFAAGLKDLRLFEDPAYQYDLVDWTRQILANAFEPLYESLVDSYGQKNDSSHSPKVVERKIKAHGKLMSNLLSALDAVLDLNPSFRLSTWLDAAKKSASSDNVQGFFEYNARDQITLWGPTGEINDYASKSWSGLVKTYYKPRWELFVDYLLETEPSVYNQTELNERLLDLGLAWVEETAGSTDTKAASAQDVHSTLNSVVKDWKDVFSV